MNKPRWIKNTDECPWCSDEMSLVEFFLREDGTAVEVWYKCVEHGFMGYAYDGRFVENFKAQKELEINVKNGSPSGAVCEDGGIE